MFLKRLSLDIRKSKCIFWMQFPCAIYRRQQINVTIWLLSKKDISSLLLTRAFNLFQSFGFFLSKDLMDIIFKFQIFSSLGNLFNVLFTILTCNFCFLQALSKFPWIMENNTPFNTLLNKWCVNVQKKAYSSGITQGRKPETNFWVHRI